MSTRHASVRSLLPRLLVLGLIAAGLTVVVPAPAANAAACARGTGVTVVVNSDVRCDPGPGGNARTHFTSGVGHSLQDAQRSPGFVCRINGFPSPAQDACVVASPADAYWSLWWSTGDGRWNYSQLGANSLTVPDGGWVAFRWNVGGGRQQPPVSPVSPAAPSSGSSSSGSGGGGSSSSSGGAGSTGSGSSGSRTSDGSSDSATADDDTSASDEDDDDPAEKKAKDDEDATDDADPSAEPTTSPSPDATEATSTDTTQGSLGWVAIVAVLAVLGLLGGFLAWRRRDGGSLP